MAGRWMWVLGAVVACQGGSTDETSQVSPGDAGGRAGAASSGDGGGRAGAASGGQGGAAPTAGSQAACGPAVAPSKGACAPEPCNPVANSCDPGRTCQRDDRDNDFNCEEPYGLLPACAPCDESSTDPSPAATCAWGTECHASWCARYCCEDADCGAGHCALMPWILILDGQLGLCEPPG